MITDLFQSSTILFLLGGFKVTLEIGVCSIICSVILGTCLGVFRYLKLPFPFLWVAATVYIDIMRNACPVSCSYWSYAS
jgi:putative glutamine transport system permease protein